MSAAMQIFSGPLHFLFMEKLFLRYTFNCMFLLPTSNKKYINPYQMKIKIAATN